MLQLSSISLLQFKNYAQGSFTFRERIVGICGANGIGKTNLLDAIYYLCFTKSYFTRTDSQNAQNGCRGFRIEGDFDRGGESLKTVCILRENGKKEFAVNEEPYEKFARHIGRLPCVIIAPDDVQIITGGSEERRRYLDALLCQLDAGYLQQLMDYNRVLVQRNGYLRSLAGGKSYDRNLLEVYDRQLSAHGSYIYEQRKAFLADLIPAIRERYRQIAQVEERLELVYDSQLATAPLPELLRQYREKDLLLQRSHAGIHKDDLLVRLKAQPFKTIASQGQRKSLLFALRLAEFATLKAAKGFAPLLLLDDIFEKLDEQRMQNLLRWVCQENDGQVFLTDTHCRRLEEALVSLQRPFQLIELP